MKQDAQWYEKLSVVSITLFFSSIVLLSIYWFAHEHLDKQYANSLLILLCKEAGVAGLVALILNLSIEWVNRRRHEYHKAELLEELERKHSETSKRLLDDVNEQVFKTVYKRNIDPRVFDQVEKHLLRATIMRRGDEAAFTLTKFTNGSSDGQEFAKLSFCNSYTVANLTDEVVSEPVVKSMVDVTPHYKEHCFFKRVTIGSRVIEKEELEKSYVKSIEGRNLISLEIKEELQANDQIAVRVEYEKLAPMDYNEIIITTVPVDRLSMEVVDPEELFTVEAISLHPEDEVKTTPQDRKYVTKWEINSPILPGQGIALLWHPRKVATLPDPGN